MRYGAGSMSEPWAGHSVPNRILREGLRSSASINTLSDGAFRLYVNLLVSADDWGLCEWCFAWVKVHAAALLAWDSAALLTLMCELEQAGLLRPYEIACKRYAAIERWQQRRNASRPKFPLPPWGEEHITGGYIAPRAKTEAKAREPGAITRPAARVNGTTLSLESLPEQWRLFCLSERPELDPGLTFGLFRDHWLANANQRSGKKSDWFAAWRNWVRREKSLPGTTGLAERNRLAAAEAVRRMNEEIANAKERA